MITRFALELWLAGDGPQLAFVEAEASDNEEVVLHARADRDHDPAASLYMTREEACTLAVLLIAAAHSEPS